MMKSPFPGMDPYLERHWLEVHQALCSSAAAQLGEQLGSDLVVRCEERSVVETACGGSAGIHTGVQVIEAGIAGTEWSPSAASAGVVASAPMRIQLTAGRFRPPQLDIVEPESNSLLTSIQFLSPTEKMPGEARSKYLKKQADLYNAHASVVEVDLIRGGTRAFLLPEAQFPPPARAEYFTCVWRGWTWNRFELYPMPLRKKLPAIRIPLRKDEEDVVLDIQKLVDQAYGHGHHEPSEYQEPCVPPLTGADALWADEMLKTADWR